ncbi:AAA family ATPase [Arthrobacter flavus]|uniref:AAA family ATPase n=1 Tax=Arthrobacter flavus TaxID=95172 RepID=A0ABW4Q9U8_9MICC
MAPSGWGKTTAGTLLAESRSDLRLFDPEVVGYMLTHMLKDQTFTDFQDLPAWRALVPPTAVAIQHQTGKHLVAVQTVLRKDYWDEIKAKFEELDVQLIQVVSDADERTIRARVENDEVEASAKQWRLDHLERYASARSWLFEEANLVINTSNLDADEVAAQITNRVRAGLGQYVRYQATEPNERGKFPGIFGLANGLAQDGVLSPTDYAWWCNANDWCNATYLDPSSVDPSVYDRATNPEAQAWFKASAQHLIGKVKGYGSLLDRYGVGCEEIWSEDPGKILYQDELQIVVAPH